MTDQRAKQKQKGISVLLSRLLSHLRSFSWHRITETVTSGQNTRDDAEKDPERREKERKRHANDRETVREGKMLGWERRGERRIISPNLFLRSI